MSLTNKLKHLLPAALLFFACWMAGAQTRTVTGTVSDVQGPMPGVSVMVKGSSTGTSTDLDGAFSLPVADKDAVLVFSFIGYRTLEFPLSGQTSVAIFMESDATLLDDAVVVG